MHYTCVLGAECIVLLCSVSHVASASFSKVIFNDVLVGSTLTLPVKIFSLGRRRNYACSTVACVASVSARVCQESWDKSKKEE